MFITHCQCNKPNRPLGLLHSENDIYGISTEKTLNKFSTSEAKFEKKLLFTKIQTILQILTESQNFPI